jgi:hypothetical protein
MTVMTFGVGPKQPFENKNQMGQKTFLLGYGFVFAIKMR